MQDSATRWLQSYPCKTKSLQGTGKSLRRFLKLWEKPKVIYTDNCLEFGKACEELSWNHCASTPHRSETHGIAERAVRRIMEGTSAVLLQSGLDEKWWADSMECYFYMRKVQDLLSDGETTCEGRSGEPPSGPKIPFGSMIENHPISSKDQSRLHQFGQKVLPGIFPGNVLYAGDEFGKETSWSRTLRSWKIWTRQKFMLQDSVRKRSSCRKVVNLSYARSQMEQSSCLEEIRFS